jgi:formylglycine-generating enzyme required for sulfatase activity
MPRKAPFHSYRGDKPYIFISYAHKDADAVYPIITALSKRGWRIWYDEGIDPGTEFFMTIEQSLMKSDQVLVFMSPQAVESQNVRQEIHLAIEERKPFLAVHLAGTQLKYGLRLRMSAVQAVLKYDYEDDEEFIAALERGLEDSCRECAGSQGGQDRAEREEVAASVPAARSAAASTPTGSASPAPAAPSAEEPRFMPRSTYVTATVSPQPAAPEPAPVQEEAAAPSGSAEPAAPSFDVLLQEMLRKDREAAKKKGPGEHLSDGISGECSFDEGPAAQAAPAAAQAARHAGPPEGMVLIPGGSFTMGSQDGEPSRSSAESPRHIVTLSPFYLGARVLTLGEFRAFAEDSGYKTDAERLGGGNIYDRTGWLMKEGASWRKPFIEQDDTHPVVLVSWNDAIEYCIWRSRREGLEPAYRKAADGSVSCDLRAPGYRLPTEAEWEYACRAGTLGPFNTGDNITTDQANYDGKNPYNGNARGEFRRRTVPVGSLPPNQWGLYEMHGNVWEWCWDRFGEYSAGPVVDPTGPTSGEQRVSRGGSWTNNGRYLRSANRNYLNPDYRLNYLGFRLARSAPRA